MERGTYLPLPVSVKNVSKEPALSACSGFSESGLPSAFKPCSRRYLPGDCQKMWLPDIRRRGECCRGMLG